MTQNRILKCLAASLLLGFSGVSGALTIANPSPATFGADINGDGLFSPDNIFIQSQEITDTSATLGFSGTEFGFYYDADPGTLIPIFQSDDQDPDPGGPNSILQQAFVNFVTGEVFDADAGFIVQNTFASLGQAEIGFYLLLTDQILGSVFGTSPIHTQAALNPGGEDMAAEFPLLASLDTFLISFASTDPSNGAQVTLGHYTIGAVTASAIPTPGTASLALLGLFVAIRSRRKNRRVHT